MCYFPVFWLSVAGDFVDVSGVLTCDAGVA
jgi:hypothetical protein